MSADPIRAALERLVFRLQETTDPEEPVPAWSDSFYAARAALDAAPPEGPAVPATLADTHYEWELQNAEGEWQAGGSSNSQSDVESEGMRYLEAYAQDGAHKLIIRQHTTQTINEITNG